MATTPKKPLFSDKQPPVDFDRDILTAEEIEAVEKEAQAEAEAELKAAAKEALKAKIKAGARKKDGRDEPDDSVFVDLAPYCDRILIDNIAYLQGQTYTVPMGRAQVMREMMQRTWQHQAEIDGKSKDFYRRTRNTVFNAANGSVMNGPTVNSTVLRA